MEAGDVCPDCGEVHDDDEVSDEEIDERFHVVCSALDGLSIDDCYMLLSMAAVDVLQGIPSEERGELRMELLDKMDAYTREAASDA